MLIFRHAVATVVTHSSAYVVTGEVSYLTRKVDPFASSEDISPDCVAFRGLGSRYDTISPLLPVDFAKDVIAGYQELDTVREIQQIAIGLIVGPEGDPTDPEWCDEWDIPTAETPAALTEAEAA